MRFNQVYLKLQSVLLSAVLFQFGVNGGHQRVSLHRSVCPCAEADKGEKERNMKTNLKR